MEKLTNFFIGIDREKKFGFLKKFVKEKRDFEKEGEY